jgi:hypothetical protein
VRGCSQAGGGGASGGRGAVQASRKPGGCSPGTTWSWVVW